MRRMSVIVLLSVFIWIYRNNWSWHFSSTNIKIADEKETKINSINLDIPTSLIIPKINLNTPITPVGLTKENIVDTLSYGVSWYENGAKPGAVGNANLNGHVTGIFRDLNKLEVGDEIYTIDRNGRQFYFKVVEKELVAVSDFSTQKVYGSTSARRLNLVTCAGRFDPEKKDFAQRTIIYSELVISKN